MDFTNIDFNQLQRDIWPVGTPTAIGHEPRLDDYALGGLDLACSELERRAALAHIQSKILLDCALHPEKYTLTD